MLVDMTTLDVFFCQWTPLWFLSDANYLVGMGGMYDTGLLSLVLQYLINTTIFK